jgi:catechol 2,3-dioxygenase-like lactoylglutathione lyase family enzyme
MVFFRRIRKQTGGEKTMPAPAVGIIFGLISRMKINSITLHTRDLEAAARFYGNLFGRAAENTHRNQVTFLAGDTRFCLKLANVTGAYHIAFNIPYNQVNSSLVYLNGRAGILPVEGKSIVEFPNWDARSVYFSDHQHNVLEFIGRRELGISQAGEFTNQGILNVSEVGIVTENVSATISKIFEKSGTKPYDKQPVLQNFAALGDAHGLFIVSRRGRHWYPTQIVAEPQPISVIFTENGTPFSMEF